MRKFLNIISDMEPSGWEAFHRFLQFDCHGKSKLLDFAAAVGDQLAKRSTPLEVEDLVGAGISSKRVSPLISELNKHLANYLAYQELKSKSGAMEIFALRQHRKRGWDWTNGFQLV